MKSKFGKILCFTLAFLLIAQPTLLSAHDFGGSSNPGGAPGENLGRDNKKNQRAGGAISLFDGSETCSEVDLEIMGYFPIVFYRTYDSRSTYDTPCGYGWDHNYNTRLFTYSDGSAVIRWENGSKLSFVQTGGSYVSSENAPGELQDNGDGTFTFTTPMGMKYEFDILGNLIQITDNRGNYLLFSYTPDKKPLTGKSPFSVSPDQLSIVSYSYQLLSIAEGTVNGLTGRGANLSYDAATGRLLSISDIAGRTVSYVHDDNGNLIRVNYPEDLFHKYEYTDTNDPNNLTVFIRGYTKQETDIPSVFYENTYDDQDRVIAQTYAGGLLEVEYTIPMVRTTVTRIVKNEEGTELHNFGNVYEYNPDGYLVSYTDEDGNRLEYIRDANNNIVRKVIWENKGTVGSPVLAVFKTTDYQYDTDFRLISRRIALGDGEILTWNYTYNHGWLDSYTLSSSKYSGKNRQLTQEFKYNDDGVPQNITKQSLLTNLSGTPEYLEIQYAYDNTGQMATIQYGNGDIDTYTYTNGLLSGINDYEYTWSPDGRTNITEIRGPEGTILTFTYDDFDRQIKVTNALAEEVLFTYEGWDLIKMETGKTVTQQGYLQTFTYDDVGRLVSQALDLSGIPYSSISYKYDSTGNLLSVTNALGQSTGFLYDAKKRLIQKTLLNGAQVTYEYDLVGNRIARNMTAAGTISYYVYDRLNRIRQMTDAAGNTVSYDYEFNNIKTITDPNGHVRTFEYDLAGRLIAEKTPAGKTTWYYYDGKGRLAKKVDANGVRTEFTYNSQDKIEMITVFTDPQRYLTSVYNDYGMIVSYADSAFGGVPILTYTYDPLNRVDTVTNQAIQKTIDYDYNNYGFLSQLTLRETAGANIFTFVYEYDSAGRLISVTEEGSRQTTVSYDNAGRVEGIDYPQGIKAIFSHESTSGWLQSMDYKKADDTILESFQYSYGDTGVMSEVADSNGTTTCSYDALFQLSGVTHPAGSDLTAESYTYDSAGNRLSSAEFSDWTCNADNQLTHFGNTDLTYDEDGNTLSMTTAGLGTSFQFDSLNRLIALSKTGTSATYQYDHAGRRIKKEVNGIARWFMYDGYRLMAEFDGSGNLLRRYGYLPDSYSPYSVADTTGYYSVLSDQMEVPRLIIDESEEIVWRGNYQAFGQMVVNEDIDGDGNPTSLNLRFPGQYFDAESGLHCNSNRFYNPYTGRFLSVDPFQDNIYFSRTLNTYIYGFNNPLAYFDLDGRKGVLGYFWEEITTRPLQNTWLGLQGKFGAGNQIFSALALTLGAAGLVLFGGAYIATGGLTMLVAVHGAKIATVAGLFGVSIPVTQQAVIMIPATIALADQPPDNISDSKNFVEVALSDPPDNVIDGIAIAHKIVTSTFSIAERADKKKWRRIRAGNISPYTQIEHHPETVPFSGMGGGGGSGMLTPLMSEHILR